MTFIKSSFSLILSETNDGYIEVDAVNLKFNMKAKRHQYHKNCFNETAWSHNHLRSVLVNLLICRKSRFALGDTGTVNLGSSLAQTHSLEIVRRIIC